MKYLSHSGHSKNIFGKRERVIVYGSLAYDRVMDFPGKFRDNFLPNKLHLINVSFAVPNLVENFGGTAGNIAYNLSLLKYKPIILSVAGNDFSKYSEWLEKFKILTNYIHFENKLPTASAYIITDKDDNQITGFYSGALQVRYRYFNKVIKKDDFIIISPGNRDDMSALVKLCVRRKITFLYDPGQQIPHLTKAELWQGVKNSLIFIGNDYEISLVAHKLCIPEKKLHKLPYLLVRTLGARGSEVHYQGKLFRIPAFKPRRIVDPTGAGDAYRAGFVASLLSNMSIDKAGRFASLVASYPVEYNGTQRHYFTKNELKTRYLKFFEEVL